MPLYAYLTTKVDF